MLEFFPPICYTYVWRFEASVFLQMLPYITKGKVYSMYKILKRRQLNENPDAVLLPDFNILHLIPISRAKIFPVNINPETCLVAVGQTHVGTTYAVAGLVINPKRPC